jgi:hypothetical protein
MSGTAAGAVPDPAAGFPWPFDDGSGGYRYTTNVEPAGRERVTPRGSWGRHVLDVDDGYLRTARARAEILAADPGRVQVLPHMEPACWDVLVYLLAELARARPDAMRLRRDGLTYHWRNDLLDVTRTFTLGDGASLGEHPLVFAGRQVPDDVVLLDCREDRVWVDAGLVTFPGDWSIRFTAGMSLAEIHGPVPRVHAMGVVGRAEALIRGLETGEPYRRLNWAIGHDGILDTSLEAAPGWAPRRAELLAAGEYGRLDLRVEVQHLVRLPLTGAVAFLIRTYPLPLAELRRVPEWAARLAGVLAELPEDMAAYKGFAGYRDGVVGWLRA